MGGAGGGGDMVSLLSEILKREQHEHQLPFRIIGGGGVVQNWRRIGGARRRLGGCTIIDTLILENLMS